MPCQAKNQELRPLVLKQLAFLNAWQSKKSYSPLVLNVPDRASVGARNRFFHRKLDNRVIAALNEIKTLRGILPICAHCKKIRVNKGYWNNLESYIQKHSEASFSHGMCPECADELYGDEDWYIKMKKNRKGSE